MPSSADDYSQVKGFSLLQNGLPHLTLNWACGCDGYDLSMQRVFGFSKDVPFESLQNLNRYAPALTMATILYLYRNKRASNVDILFYNILR